MIGEGIGAHVPLPPGAAGRFDRFDALLNEWNGRMDLTAVAQDALHRHYLDSLTALPLIPAGSVVIDVGAGAGFPGVPLALARPDTRVTLLDALGKRVRFLQAAIDAVPIENAEAVHARAEDFARARREGFDIAVSRAVAALPVLLEWLLPLVAVGGRCILWKGPGAEAEIEAAERALPLLGGGALAVHPAEVPGTDWQHLLITVDKAEPTPAHFPRRAGMALKRPLQALNHQTRQAD